MNCITDLQRPRRQSPRHKARPALARYVTRIAVSALSFDGLNDEVVMRDMLISTRQSKLLSKSAKNPYAQYSR